MCFSIVASDARTSPNPGVAYSLRIDSLHLDRADVEIRFRGAPGTFHLGMKVHAEYDGAYWRYLENIRAEGAAPGTAGVTREDSTLWRVTLPGGTGVVRYTIRIQPATDGLRGAWRPTARPDGAFVNGPDFFLYPVEFPGGERTLALDVPVSWRIATALPVRDTSPRALRARDTETLLDAPVLLGALRAWTFVDRGTTFHLVYWPLPNAVPFDTIGFARDIRRLAGAAIDVFGRTPAKDFWFLFQDGANDALEHRASVAVGVPSADIADGHPHLYEIAHEFFHAWNLVAIHAVGYNELSHRPPQRTLGLWMGEGVTLHYADVLLRRAGLADTSQSRLAHLTGLLRRYYSLPTMRIGPERASLAFGDSPVVNPDATGGYYLQGELLANVIDGLVRDSTHERRGVDDVMRALFAESERPGYAGFTSASLETTVNSVCGCTLASLFVNSIRGSAPIDFSPALRRLGYTMSVDSVPAEDSVGHAIPDVRLSAYVPNGGGSLIVGLINPVTPWYIGGLRTGDELRTIDGIDVSAFAAFRRALGQLHIGDRVAVGAMRNGQMVNFAITVTGYTTPRVRFIDLPVVTAEQRARRAAWLSGR